MALPRKKYMATEHTLQYCVIRSIQSAPSLLKHEDRLATIEVAGGSVPRPRSMDISPTTIRHTLAGDRNPICGLAPIFVAIYNYNMFLSHEQLQYLLPQAIALEVPDGRIIYAGRMIGNELAVAHIYQSDNVWVDGVARALEKSSHDACEAAGLRRMREG